jgi:hypothetical protein
MWRWTREPFQSWRLAWTDASALLEHFSDSAFEEAEQRALDPRGVDEQRRRGHWSRVARIVAWRSGQDSAAQAPAPVLRPRAAAPRKARAR